MPAPGGGSREGRGVPGQRGTDDGRHHDRTVIHVVGDETGRGKGAAGTIAADAAATLAERFFRPNANVFLRFGLVLFSLCAPSSSFFLSGEKCDVASISGW